MIEPLFQEHKRKHWCSLAVVLQVHIGMSRVWPSHCHLGRLMLFSIITTSFRFVCTGNYMFIETSNPRKFRDRARLESEVFAPTPSNGRCMSFWYHMKGGHIGSLSVYMRVYGQSETKLWSVSLDQGNQWNSAVVPILSGNRFYQVR